MARKWKDLVEDVGYTQDVIAKVVPKGDVRGFLKKDVIIDPGEVAVLITEGKIEDVLTQTKLKNFGGGFGGWLERKLGKSEDEILLFMVTTPVDLEMPVTATSKDYVETTGKCTVKVQLREENATKIFNLLQKEQFMTKTGLEDRILPEIDANVFKTTIPKYDAEEFHGNKDVIKEMETAVEVELRKTFDLYGINLLKVFTSWEPGAYDELMEYKTQVKMLEERKDIDHNAVIGDMTRQHEVLKREQEDRWDLTFGNKAAELGLSDMEIQARIKWDAAKYDEQVRQYRETAAAELEKKRADAELEAEMENREAKRAMDMFQQVQEAKRERIGMEQDFKMKQMETQTGTMERLMSEAVKEGAADSSALQEMMRQMTMQKMADREVEKVKAVSEAEKARFDLETYKEAEDRERDHTVKRMDADAKLMDAAKQKLPETLVQGSSIPVIKTEPAARERPQPQVPKPETPRVSQPQTLCPNCGDEVLPGWAICPGCGAPLAEKK